jgi:hypothetical protein
MVRISFSRRAARVLDAVALDQDPFALGRSPANELDGRALPEEGRVASGTFDNPGSLQERKRR